MELESIVYFLFTLQSSNTGFEGKKKNGIGKKWKKINSSKTFFDKA